VRVFSQQSGERVLLRGLGRGGDTRSNWEIHDWYWHFMEPNKHLQLPGELGDGSFVAMARFCCSHSDVRVEMPGNLHMAIWTFRLQTSKT
jgi:hypothetical protein